MSKKLFIQTEAQQKWVDIIEKLGVEIEKLAQVTDETQAFPFSNIELLRKAGYTKLTLPKKYGGEGFSIYDIVLLQETLAKFDGSTALIIGWTLLYVGNVYEHEAWSEETLQAFAKHIQNGAIVNSAISEFATGSPMRGGRPLTTAIKDKDGWRITGRKNYTTGSYILDFFNTSAWIEEQQRIGFFLIPKEAEGLSIEENWDVISMRGTGSHDLVLNDVYVEENALVEVLEPEKRIKLNAWLLTIPATYLGIAQAARDYAVNFALSHSPNSIEGTISQLPNIQTLIGEIELELTKARFSIYSAATIAMNEPENDSTVHMINSAKHVVTNAAITIVDKAMRVVGAKSLQRNNPLQRYYRDVRAGLHNPPMDDVTIKLLAQHAFQNNDSK